MPKKFFFVVAVVIAVIIASDMITQIIHELRAFEIPLAVEKLNFSQSVQTDSAVYFNTFRIISALISAIAAHAAQSCCVMPSRHLSAPYESCVTHIFNAGPWAWNAPLVFNTHLWN